MNVWCAKISPTLLFDPGLIVIRDLKLINRQLLPSTFIQ